MDMREISIGCLSYMSIGDQTQAFALAGNQTDVDSGLLGPCVVVATNKFTQTTEVLLRKRDSMAAL